MWWRKRYGTTFRWPTCHLPFKIRKEKKRKHTKQYEFTIQLGQLTKSYDLGTDTIETKDWNKQMSLDDLKLICDEFKNADYWQVPPAYSAKKVNGIRAYKLV